MWEGDSLVFVNLKDKGDIRFWYWKNGVPRIDNIGQFSTFYDCFYVDKYGIKTGYAFSMNLVLNNENIFSSWFPFQVNNLKELVERYDEIIAVLNNFPKNSETVSFEDKRRKFEVVKQSDPKYIIKQRFRGRNVWCDLYQN